MKQSMHNKLTQMEVRLEEVGQMLTAEDAAHDMNSYRKLNREHSELTSVVTEFQTFKAAQEDLATAEMLRGDPEMKAFAEDEYSSAQTRSLASERRLELLLLPTDPNDEKNVLLEIRAGTGGDESALFAGDLLRMYTRYAERNRWQIEVMSESPSDLGGYKEIILRLAGDSVYSRMKFESGGHRVQRVPATETQGRIHTSACTVAVLAEADEVSDVHVSPDELRIDVYRASGAGGQHVNKTESAVRITHLPTGIVAECQDGRSQHSNKAQAMKVLLARIKDKQEREAHAKESATRKSLIGSGDRSERIRTYNFPQGRITDHRINLTLYKLAFVMDGDIGELTSALITEHQAELLATLGGDN
jgi:peptide chain release factor 1